MVDTTGLPTSASSSSYRVDETGSSNDLKVTNFERKNIRVMVDVEAPNFQQQALPPPERLVMSEEMKQASSLSVLLQDKDESSIADRHPIPQCLVGDHLLHRSDEEHQIQNTFQAMLLGEEYSLVLVQGAIGTGRTRLVHHSLQCQQNKYFVRGKFDQLQRPEPYRGFVSAFTDFTNQVVARGPKEVSRIQRAIAETVGADACGVLTSMIPTLEQILPRRQEQQHDASNAKADDAIQRFVFVFKQFIRALCSLEEPLVLLLDDIHWADPCSLDVLTSLVLDLHKSPGLFIVATCDNCSPAVQDVNSYLAKKLREMENDGGPCITSVTLHNLNQRQVNQMLGNALEQSTPAPALGNIESLGSLVLEHTGGNLFHMTEFFRWLQGAGLLTYDDGSWAFDVDEIRMTIEVENIHDFLQARLGLLPELTKDFLKVAACLGSHVDQTLIEYVLGMPADNFVWDAVSRGILVEDTSTGKYRFEHDGIQAAAYKLIPENERELFHLEVGRRLWRHLSQEELDQHIFVVLSQVNIGKRLVTREKERYALANICLHAGMKAAKSSTFRTAAIYLNLGIEMLDSNSWREAYDLTLALYNAGAEMMLCIANYDSMDKLIESILREARTSGDVMQARATQIYALGVQGKQQDSIDLGIASLKSLGVRFPRRLCRARLKQEMLSVRRSLKGMSNEMILRLPTMMDRDKIACMQVMNLIFLNTLLVRPRLAPFVTLKMMKLTLTYGLSTLAPTAFATYGMFCVHAGNDLDSAFRFGDLSLVLIEKLEVREYLARVYAAVYGCINCWRKPLRECIERLLEAKHLGMQTGDIEFAGLNANLYCFLALDAGVPLDRIHTDWQSFQETMVSHRQEALLRMSWSCIHSMKKYMGISSDEVAGKEGLDVDKLLEESIKLGPNISALSMQETKMSRAYIFNDYLTAESVANVIEQEIWSIPPTFEVVHSSFMLGMVFIAAASEGRRYRRNIRQAKVLLKHLKRYAELCPSNCLGRKFLLEAEIASVEKKDAKAYEKYKCAILVSKEESSLHIEALGNERMARHFCARNMLDEALPYFRSSLEVYGKWGGHAKVTQLQAEMESIYDFWELGSA